MAYKQSVVLFHNRTFIYSRVIGVYPYYTIFCGLNCIHNSRIYKHRIHNMFCKNKMGVNLTHLKRRQTMPK